MEASPVNESSTELWLVRTLDKRGHWWRRECASETEAERAKIMIELEAEIFGKPIERVEIRKG